MKLFFRLLVLICLIPQTISAQNNWKQVKDKDGIKVFTSESAGSKFKAIRVECDIPGTCQKLISVVSNVEALKDWVYNSRTSKLLKKNSAYDYLYYAETHLPWPLSNRDVVIHLRIRTDSLPKFITITGNNEEGIVPELPDLERVTHYKAGWRVTQINPASVHVSYTVEVDPGGSIPAWLSNMFADKGPYETFRNLAERMKN